jgi:hypothetical protein
MRKWLFAFAGFLILFFISFFIFIPSNLKVSKAIAIRCNAQGAYRILSNENTWNKWWPGYDSSIHLDTSSKYTFNYQKEVYRLKQKLLNGVEVNIGHNESLVNSTMILIPLRRDSVIIEWQSTIVESNNPFKRIAGYLHAVNIKKNMDPILEGLHNFLEVQKNVYGSNITETSTTDTLLVALKSHSNSYPSTADIYQSVNLLKNYIITNGAIVTGHPMINITNLNKTEFEIMVALPTNKELKENNNIFFRRMIPGNFLVTEVKGGNYTLMEAENGMEEFMNDYQKTAMAIPFQSLITDRDKETDTSKWITKLYEPVMR